MVEGLAMRKFLVLVFSFAGIGFSQQSEFPNPEVIDRLMGLCEHSWKHCKELNWKQCKELRLRMLSIEKECLEKSQSYDAFRECIVYFLLRIGRGA
jgi:hypothetical protein